MVKLWRPSLVSLVMVAVVAAKYGLNYGRRSQEIVARCSIRTTCILVLRELEKHGGGRFYGHGLLAGLCSLYGSFGI